MSERGRERTFPARILIVHLGAIGDVANALVLAPALKTARPSTHVGWAAHPLAAPLVDGHPDVDRMHLWPRNAGLAGLQEFLRGVRAERYDLVIDLQRILKSALVARLTRAPRILGFDRARAKELAWIWTRERIPPGRRDAHMVVQYLEFARYLGVPVYGAVPRFPESPAAETRAAELVAGLGAAPIVLNLGASKAQNRWPAERFGLLARRITAVLHLPVLFTGGPGDVELAAAARAALESAPSATAVRPGAPPAPALDLVGRTDLLVLLALLRRAHHVVSCDTGPMHLAAAVQTPVVALFGPADPSRTGPWGERHRVVRAPGVPGRMSELGVDLVFGALRESLAWQG
jgi:ADP-heptose:LPS heptosyltransferase